MRENRYFRHAKISERQFLGVLEDFSNGKAASACAAATGLSLRTVNALFVRLRNYMVERCAADPLAFGGSGQNLLDALRPKGLAGMSAEDKRLALFHEHIRCVGQRLLERISKRALRPATYPAHAFELYLSAKCERRIYFESSPGADFSLELKSCVACWVEDNHAEFRKRVADLPPAATVWRSHKYYGYDDLYDELYWTLSERPL